MNDRPWYASAVGPQDRVPLLDHAALAVPRVYSALLGGKDCLSGDLELAQRLASMAPVLPRAVRANRAFRRAAVSFMAEQGIDQFIDIGCGFPDHDSRSGGVHHVARQTGKTARVVYVDHNPVVLAHVRALHGGEDGVKVVDADLRDPDSILTAPNLVEALDLSRPVGLLLAAVLHLLPDEAEACGVMSWLRGALAPGSLMTVTHAELTDDPRLVKAAALYAAEVAPFRPRTREQVAAFFDGWELLAPGVVPVTAWRPTLHPDLSGPDVPVLAGVARKPEAGHVP